MADEEDDYLSMTFDDDGAASKAPETSLQRTARLKREAAARAHQPGKRDLAVQAAKQRQAVLDTALDARSSIGARMMAKMGFREGGTLGVAEDALREPLRVQVRLGKGGIGTQSSEPEEAVRGVKRDHADADDGLTAEARVEKEAAAQYQREIATAKRQKVELGEYRERAQTSAEERRAQAQLTSAMKVLETMEAEAEAARSTDVADAGGKHASALGRPSLHTIPVLRRRLARDQLGEECQRTRDLLKAQTIATRGAAGTALEDPKRAFLAAAEIELADEDSELEEFEALSASERLEKVVLHLRKEHRYCFWCMGAYDDDEMEGCPGLTEDEHG